MAATARSVSPRGLSASPWPALWAIFKRDVVVTGRELWVFLAQVLLQPLATLFIFGRILPDIGMASGDYAKILMPGMIVLTIILTALQSTAMPLVIEFSWTKEIEDRLLAPLPVTWVGAQKIVFAAARGLIAGIVIFPLGILIIGAAAVHVTWGNVGPIAFYAVMAALIGATIGLTLGTMVRPQQINIMFALILTPMMFTGCTQYPWPELANLRWFQILTLFNPMTYASEGLRGAMIPQVPHLSSLAVVPAVLAFTALFGVLGIRGFLKRAVD
jgi:ABC-2 type transport system permease protein